MPRPNEIEIEGRAPKRVEADELCVPSHGYGVAGADCTGEADCSAEATGAGAAKPLPLARTATVAAAPAVLVVEDQPAIRLSVCAALRQRGFRVLEAESGRAAMVVAREDRIAAMLVDVSLPDVSGLELAGNLRELHDDAALVVMSAYSRAEVTRKGRLPDRSVFVQKPVAIVALLQLVEEVIAASQR